jgi:hypothetical protein
VTAGPARGRTLPRAWTARPAGRPSFHFFVDELAFDVYCLGIEAEHAAADVGYFYPTDAGAARHRVSGVFVLHARVPGRGPLSVANAAEVELLGYPSAPRSGRRWVVGDWTVVETDRPRARFVVNRRTGLVRIAGSNADVLESFPRTLRLLLRSRLEARGFGRLHSAAAAVDGRGIAVAGGRGSGKTTLLIDLVRGAGARVVSFDKLFVKSAAEVQCIGEPASLGLALGTARRFGMFVDRFPAGLQRLSPHDAWAMTAPSDKARVPAGEVAAALPPAAAATHHLTAVLLADLKPDLPPSIRPLTEAEAREAISLLSLGATTTHQPDWAGLSQAKSFQNDASLGPQLAKSTPFYRVSFGATSPVGQLRALRDAITA